VDDRLQTLGDEVRRRLGPGVILEPRLRERFEGRLGADLSATLVHRSPLGGPLARAFGAQALTVHRQVIGSANDLDADTTDGEALLAHELTHVVQRQNDEAAAQSTEQAVRAEAQTGQTTQAARSTIDRDALAERVYQRLLREVRLERERAAGTGW